MDKYKNPLWVGFKPCAFCAAPQTYNGWGQASYIFARDPFQLYILTDVSTYLRSLANWSSKKNLNIFLLKLQGTMIKYITFKQ